MKNYKREITHTHYKNGDKKTEKGGFSRMLQMRITHNKYILKKHQVGNEDDFVFANDVFLTYPVVSNIAPLWLGGTFLILFLGFLIISISSSEVNTLFDFLAIGFLFLGFLFFLIYYFTMPKKECIFNREDGRVTFPGFMWHKNITMPIKEMLFSMSSPSRQGGGAFLLQIVRPDKTYSFYLCTLGNSCYEDLSFFLWYMDKNRPLPPGTAFDEYRDDDFERRKAAGFPKPLFESDIETPEATERQQIERKKIGGW